MLKPYLQQVSQTLSHGDAREESFYDDLKNLLQAFAEDQGKKKIHITVLPKKTEAGNPDFRIWDGMQHIVGYVEAKTPDSNLDVVEDSEQLKRYRETFPNLILTNFYEFRLYRDGEKIETVQIARLFISKKLKTVPPVEHEKEFLTLLEKFFAFSLPKVFNAEKLAEELAKRTRFLRDEVITIELEEEEKGKGILYGTYEAFKKYLIANLKEEDFADIYSQTITYGMFAARTRSTNGFSRRLAYELIPQTIGILRDVFQFISLGNLPKQMEVIIDDIAEVLHVADVNNILHQYYKAGKGDDPIVHFYETFLNIYDPETREKRGVYYTPEPVVRYIVRSVHELLKTHFELEDGLASREVTLLDPAGGTLTFPAEAIKLAAKEYTDKYGDGGLPRFISSHILKNFYAFELMMAPYAIGHIKISFLLDELNYKLKDDERFKLYLTNTLDMEDLAQTQIPGLESLSTESHEAGKVKQNEPILVIIGNPPYSGISANINKWTEELLKTNLDGALSYYEMDGKPLGEKKLWLQDDYVKFLRFAQWKIHKAGRGIVGMITNHGYLDNPTFRGMRQSLMHTFNEIYIIDLHGNSSKKETAPDGSKDENVFDIRQGVAIAIFVKKEKTKGCNVFHRDNYGLREEKYQWLDSHDFKVKNYEKLLPASPWYFFIERNTKDIEHYNDWMKLNEIFPVNNVGIVTSRDSFVIDFDREPLEARIRQFRNLKFDDDFMRSAYKLKDTSTFKMKHFRDELSKDKSWDENFKTITYRPFDVRNIYYSKWVIERPIYDNVKHLLQANLSICFIRQYSGNEIYSHALVSEYMVDNRTFFSSKGIIQQAPLYLYKPALEKKSKSIQSMMLFEPEVQYDSLNRIPNIAKEVFENLQGAFKKKPTPEEILCYIYAMLYSNVYREKYAEFLKIDFPRIPFTKDYKLFKQLAALGEELTQLHLLKSKLLSKPIAKFRGAGEDVIEKVVYGKENCVYINPGKYFEGVSPVVWNYQIGGYQVMEKFLKDRKGRHMTDAETYCKIATAIHHTIIIQKQIDEIYAAVESKLL